MLLSSDASQGLPNGVRLATEADIAGIQRLINENLDKVLPRTDEEIRELLPMWWVAVDEGEIVGTCCLEVYSRKIAELRSLVVRDKARGKGYGAALVKIATETAQALNIYQVLVVTSTPEFFEALDFGPALGEKYALFWHGSGTVKARHAPNG
ncbi:MAG: GNAT family N-acetyltransferase [Chloroflexi bacterium CFX4]|nr:GNAT family N-acetyltransferase [Chloroflexi bacterium CFX4]MDL1921437.1 GNAT family N-acetyltransferase [Chloroflexi bacterium CFX3]